MSDTQLVFGYDLVLTFYLSNGRMLAVVGTRQATIQIFLFDLSNGLIPLLEKPSMFFLNNHAEIQANISSV